MSEYYSRLHIRVFSPEVWNKFEGNRSYDLEDIIDYFPKLAEEGATSLVLNNWSWNEIELEDKVKVLKETLGQDGIVISDTNNISVDSYNYCVYYLGGRLRKKSFNRSNMFRETNIKDIPSWLNYGEFFKVSEKEEMVLSRCGLSFADGSYTELEPGKYSRYGGGW